MVDEVYRELMKIMTEENAIFEVIPYIIDVLFGMMGMLIFISFLDSLFAFIRSGGDGHAMDSAVKGIRSNFFTFLALYIFWVLLRLTYSYTVYLMEELVI